MGLPRSTLRPSQALFHRIVPSAAANPVGQITLPVTFGAQENFHTECLQFKVANFETTYNAFLGRPRLSKFIAILINLFDLEDAKIAWCHLCQGRHQAHLRL
jgi:hypothetical protein